MQMNHVMEAPRPFTLFVDWRIPQRIEYPRSSAAKRRFPD